VSHEYEIIIGLEVHAELQTKSKIFCSCPNSFGQKPNTNVCPVCLGLPGSLPVFNESALDLALMAALALNCEISTFSRFDRKNYFYPDLPKAYQISQYDFPVARNGYLDLVKEGETIRRIRIDRLHLEEDAGKLQHDPGGSSSYVDFNRCGVPLMEIVSAPDLRSPEEARLYLETLKKILLYTGTSDCKMEEGSLRCDANISLRPVGSKEFGAKVEIKNMNSFKAVQKGLEYEVFRQEKLLREGERVYQETRRWFEERGITLEMRGKEEEKDYRYFPEPDLPPLNITAERVRKIRELLPELPVQRASRYIKEYQLTPYQAEVITSSQGLADFFEETLKGYRDAQKVSNWLLGDVLKLVNEQGEEIEALSFQPAHLAELLSLLDEGVISGRTAKEVLEETFQTGKVPREVVQAKGLVQISDEKSLLNVIDKVLAENKGAVEDYTSGNKKALAFLVGSTMKHTKGQANPQLVQQLLRKRLDG